LPIVHALDHAHEQKIIHRDVKPANILLTHKGLPMLTDFGVVKMLEVTKTQTLTGTGVGIGTPEYISLEQSLSKDVDGRTDIYSLVSSFTK
jgi:serine/threonine protein kinase